MNSERPPVYVISVMNFRQHPTDYQMMHTVTLQSDKKPDHPFYDKLKLIYIQLPNITDHLGTTHPLTNWLNVIQNLHRNEEPMLINTDSKTKNSILAAMTIAEYESLTTAEKTVIELSQYAEAEAYSILETAKMDAKQEGREEGALQKALETARNLLSMNLPHVQIAQATGLTLELVQAVAKTDTDPTSKS